MNRWWSVALLGICAACSEEGGPTGPVDPLPASVPIVEQSIGFGDPPLSGLLSFSPTPDGTTGWRFRIEVDGSGTPAREGFVAAGPAMAFRFEEPGVHELVVHLERGDQRTTVTKRVIVNDPLAVRIDKQRVVVSDESFDDLAGIVYLSSSEDYLFVTQHDRNTILRIDPVSLLVGAELTLPITVVQDPFGLAISQSQGELYVASEIGYLSTVSIPEMELIESMRVGSSLINTDLQVELLGPNTVVLGGDDGVVIFDTETGQVLRERVIENAIQFAVNPDRSTIAVIQYLEDRSAIWLLDASTMAELAVIPLPDQLMAGGATIAYKPDGSRLYVLGTDDSELLHFYVIDTTSFQIVTDQPMEPCNGCLQNHSNPAATSGDGRYLLIPGLLSSYVIDTTLDLPLYRTPAKGWSVAASPSGHEFFLTHHLSGAITKVVVDP